MLCVFGVDVKKRDGKDRRPPTAQPTNKSHKIRNFKTDADKDETEGLLHHEKQTECQTYGCTRFSHGWIGLGFANEREERSCLSFLLSKGSGETNCEQKKIGPRFWIFVVGGFASSFLLFEKKKSYQCTAAFVCLYVGSEVGLSNGMLLEGVQAKVLKGNANFCC